MTATDSSVIVVVLDGVRPDTLRDALDAGHAPALRQLRDDGGDHTITTVFPSVTGLGYVPFVAGRHPVPAGIPGLRWYDRARTHIRRGSHARSYIGWAMRYFDRDLHPEVDTLFQHARPSFGAMTMIGRGLAPRDWLGTGLNWQLRGARIHFGRGGLKRWLEWDRDVAGHVAAHVRRHAPQFTLAAVLTPDKVQHAEGQQSPKLLETIRIGDALVAELRHDLERAGRWDRTQLWIVSDHGHSPTPKHDELVDVLLGEGLTVAAHPFAGKAKSSDVVVGVSGNAQAHIYLDPQRRTRLGAEALAGRWGAVTDLLSSRESVDLAIVPLGDDTARVSAPGRGAALVRWSHGRVSYLPQDGDPLRLDDELSELDAVDAWDACLPTDHPDGLVQIAAVAGAARSGDVILSAAREWDFRKRYEPVLHVSGHGALHREHMLVPMLLNRPPVGVPRRTVDIGVSAARALQLDALRGADGASFV
ncbi:MAG: alkaline phosphatase family protein [Gemmatimonadaceae bacterium]|nr:alkaline phosphatase family protein [Gemmatimonadaceae bacterium]